ncbi:hypothetical protein [Desulforamulus ferrireducens]|nr:hypothetical protein [Desulforamulus ferrireducens]
MSLDCLVFLKKSQLCKRLTYITQYFDMLSEKYNIKNEIFVNKELYKNFISRSKDIISKLKESESKDIASDEQFEELNIGIENFLKKKLSIEQIYNEINRFRDKTYINKKIYFKMYNRFVSSITTKLVLKFALDNITITSLEVNCLDLKNKVINVKGFKLPLDSELTELLTKYLEIREYVLNLQSKIQNVLFIKPDGEPYITVSNNKEKPDCTRLFKIMNDILHNVATDLFASRRILEMLDKGIDISTVANLSGRSTDKCIELQRNYLSDAGERLQQFFKEEETGVLINENYKKKAVMKCLFCGKDVKPISEEWVLVQFKEDGPKHLACRECKGKNGKYRL